MKLRERAMVVLGGLVVAAAGCSGGPAEPAMALNVRYAPDGTLVVFSGSAIDTYGPDLTPKAHIPVLSGLGPLFSLSDDGRVAAVASSVSDHQVQLVNLSGARGRVIDLGLSPAANSYSPQGLTLSPTGDLLFVVAGVGGQGDMSGMFDTSTGALLWTVEAAYGVRAFFSTDESALYTLGTSRDGGGLQKFDSRTGTVGLDAPLVDSVQGFGGMPDPTTLVGVAVSVDPVSYTESTEIDLFSTADGSLTRRISLAANTTFAGNIATSAAFRCTPAASSCVMPVVETDPSTYAIVANAVQVWALDGTLVQSIDNVSGDVAISPAGQEVAVIYDGDVTVDRVSDGALVKVLPYLNRTR